MSLFVCQKCKAIENTNCCHSREYLTNVVDDAGNYVAGGYPDMGLMDMQGHGDKVYVGETYKGTKLFKEKDEILMLCSECNVGKWHGEFSKDYATDEELELAKYSAYNMITPYDHDENIIIADNDAPHGYRLTKTDDIVKLVGGDKLEEVKAILERPMNTDEDIEETKRSLQTLLAATNVLNPDMLTTLIGGTKRNRKDTQSEEEKDRALNLAELKREIKRLKKSKADKSIIAGKQEEYNKLKNTKFKQQLVL